MNRVKKIVIIVGLVGISVGGFALTKYLTRNVKKVVGGVIRFQTYDTPAQPVEFEN